MHEANLDETETLLSPEAASTYLKQRHDLDRTPRTLQVMRREGRGPTYRRHANEVRYSRTALDAWVAALFSTEVASTAEESARRLVKGGWMGGK
jgi:hypothetical protein